MDLIEANSDNLLISVPTRFIRDWITSRYLDNVIQEIIGHKIERKNKVLDLSDVEVSTKIDTQ